MSSNLTPNLSMTSLPSAVATAKLVALVTEQRKQSKDEGNTLNLRNLEIAETLPAEVIEMIKDEVSRLDLAQNQLFHFDSEFKKLTRLRYLDIRSNKFREFPDVLCSLTSLEILDISRNKIRILPRKLSQLKSLKVLSIGRNRVQVLPTTLADMPELRALTVARNPLVFPPSEICNYDPNLDDMEVWLGQLKEYMRNKGTNYDGNESGLVTRYTHHLFLSLARLFPGWGADDSDEEVEPYSADPRRPKTFGRSYSLDTNSPAMPSFPPSSRSDSPYSTVSSGSSSQFVAPLAPPPLPSKNLHRTNGLHRSNRSLHNTTVMERSRSHSEASQNPQDAKPRRRAESTQRHRPGLSQNAIEEGRVSRNQRHTRGISHDSGTQDDEDSGLRSSPIEAQAFSAYFRRLSIMPASVRVSLSSIKVVEASRGILFALSQVHQAAQQYVGLCGDAQLSRTINRVLYNAKTHVGTLIDALEAHEGKGEGADIMPVVEACNACVGSFRHVINILLQHIQDLADRADVRLTRTFLLLIYGAAVELQNSWAGLRPSLPIPAIERPVIPSPIPTLKNNSPQANRLKTIVGAPPNITLPPTPGATMKIETTKLDYNPPPTPFAVPPTPSVDMSTMAENDEPLFEKIQTATTTALSVLAYISDQVAKLHVPGQIAPGKELPGVTMAKLKELGAYSVSTADVTKRLRGRVQIVRERKDMAERKKFWEDTNAFVKAVIAIAQLARTVSIDFKFPEHINQGLSALTRSTKEAALLLSGSSFRSMADDTTPKPPALAPIHATGLGQTSLTSLLSPMNNISPLNISSPAAGGFGSGMASPVVAFGQQGLNKFDATIVQMRQAQQAQQVQQQQAQGVGQGAGDQTVRSPLPPPIVSIPLPRE